MPDATRTTARAGASRPTARQAWDTERVLLDPAWYPNEHIVRFTAKYLRKRTGLKTWTVRRPVQVVLDLGCGTGRHMKFLVEQGVEAHGLDCSLVSLRFVQAWMRSLSLPARLVAGSSTHLPYRSGAFDAVISHGVLDHMTFEEARATVAEVRRTLRSDGLFYLDLISTQDSGYGQGQAVAPETFLVPEGLEEGAIQRFYDEAGIEALLAGSFRIEDLVFQEWHPVRGRGWSNLDKTAASPAKLARFHLVGMVA